MSDDTCTRPTLLRIAALAGIAVLGMVAIVGSGGGGSDSAQCSFFSNTCNITSLPATFEIYMSPSVSTVQVGGTVTFKVSTNAATPSYQWKRSADRGKTYVAIPGATGASYTLAGAQLTDDQALFLADVSSPGAQPSAIALYTRPAVLLVSSMPGVVFEDSEFLPGDWVTAAIADPAQGGPTDVEEQAASGGNPGAFRRMSFLLPAGPSSLRAFNTLQTASYDPAVSGAIYSIDFAEDCLVASVSASVAYVDSGVLVEQGGRRYAAIGSGSCSTTTWTPAAAWPSLTAADLPLIDGPACATGEACPDFTANGAPLKFGFVRGASLAAGKAAGSIVNGIDNWKVTVWRR